MNRAVKNARRNQALKRIKQDEIIERLNQCALGKERMENCELQAAKMLLDRVAPTMKAIEQNIEHDVTVQLVQFSTGEVIEHGQNTHTQPALLSGASVPSNGTGH